MFLGTSVLVRCTAANSARNSVVNTSLSNESSDSAEKQGDAFSQGISLQRL